MDIAAQVEAQVEAPVEAPVELSDTDKAILVALAKEPLGRSSLLQQLGYKQRTGNFKKSLGKLLAAELIKMTIPDKPNSRMQKYQVTEKGRKILD